MKMRVRFGESVGEAMSDIGTKSASNDHAIRDGVHDIPFMGVVEIGNTGFRFVRLDLVTTGKANLECVRAVSLMLQMPRLGEFRCSDERLNRVWETAVRTVHLCCQDFLWDGIKRDRLVWLGDMHPEARTILSVFGAAEVLSDSIDYAIATTPADGGSLKEYLLLLTSRSRADIRRTRAVRRPRGSDGRTHRLQMALRPLRLVRTAALCAHLVLDGRDRS